MQGEEVSEFEEEPLMQEVKEEFNLSLLRQLLVHVNVLLFNQSYVVVIVPSVVEVSLYPLP
jgi:hypothetical protein